MDNYFEILKNEFEAGDDSFLINLRCGLTWDKEAFIRLVTAMETCCETVISEDKVERWLAEGFWYVPQFTKDWSSHQNFPKEHPPEYYEAAYYLLNVLAERFFVETESGSIDRNSVEYFFEKISPKKYSLF